MMSYDLYAYNGVKGAPEELYSGDIDSFWGYKTESMKRCV
jgi:hypothetical protein